MKTLVTDLDFIRGAFPLLAKEQQDELTGNVIVFTTDAGISKEAHKEACKLAVDEWLTAVYNSMEPAEWDTLRENGYDEVLLHELRESVGRLTPHAFTPHPNGISLWDDVLFLFMLSAWDRRPPSDL